MYFRIRSLNCRNIYWISYNEILLSTNLLFRKKFFKYCSFLLFYANPVYRINCYSAILRVQVYFNLTWHNLIWVSIKFSFFLLGTIKSLEWFPTAQIMFVIQFKSHYDSIQISVKIWRRHARQNDIQRLRCKISIFLFFWKN